MNFVVTEKPQQAKIHNSKTNKQEKLLEFNVGPFMDKSFCQFFNIFL